RSRASHRMAAFRPGGRASPRSRRRRPSGSTGPASPRGTRRHCRRGGRARLPAPLARPSSRGGRRARTWPPPRILRVDPRPIGVFDSGMGGLTVLHECLVTLPHEDFVYLGDGARLPYGPRPLPEIRRFAAEIAGYLEQQGVKLIVAACNSA